jgi:hypothetical protein
MSGVRAIFSGASVVFTERGIYFATTLSTKLIAGQRKWPKLWSIVVKVVDIES